MSSYAPEYISQVMSFVSGDVVTADEFNTVLNKVIHQGDHNSEWLNYLDTVGIPAAVAEITGEDLEEYIQEEVQEEIQALTSSSASRTTGYTKTKDCVIINTSSNAVLAQDFANINNMWTPATTALPPYNPIPAGYSGSDITAMTSENRASDCTSLRNAINNIVTLDIMPYIYQSKSSTDGIAPSYMYNNIAAYLYKVSAIVDYDTVRTRQEGGHPMQFPVCEVANGNLVTAALANATIDSCCIIAAPIGDMTYAEIAALRTSIATTNGFNIITFKDFLTKWLKNLYTGSTVYATQLSEGRRQHYSNVLTDKIRFAVDKADGTAALFDYTDILKLSEDKLTFTNNDGSLVVTDAAGNVKITYTPSQAIIDNTLVGNTATTSELPVLVTTAGSGSGTSYTNSTVKVGNGTIKVNNKNVPWVQSYNSSTGVLTLGGLS